MDYRGLVIYSKRTNQHPLKNSLHSLSVAVTHLSCEQLCVSTHLAVVSRLSCRGGLPGQRLAIVNGRLLGGGVGGIDDDRSLRAAAVFAAAGLVPLSASIPGGEQAATMRDRTGEGGIQA